MSRLFKSLVLTFIVAGFLGMPSAMAKNSDSPRTGHISGRTVVAGVLSLLIWPGIGQAVNNNKGEKVITHAAIGILPPYRFWSGYDALMDRKGGYWKGRI